MFAGRASGRKAEWLGKPELTREEIEKMLTFHLPEGGGAPFAVLESRAACCPEVILASPDFISLFGVDTLAAINGFDDQGGKKRALSPAHRLADFAQSLAVNAAAKEGLLRFKIGRATKTLKILARLVEARDGGGAPLSIITVLNSPARGKRSNASQPAEKWPEAQGAVPQPASADGIGVKARLELALRQQKSAYRELAAILDTATDGIAVLDQAGLIQSLNRSGEALFGYEQSEAVGRPFTDLIAPDNRAEANAYFIEFKAAGGANLLNPGREVLGLARQGGPIALFMTLGQIGEVPSYGKRKDESRGLRFCAILRDLTHWKKVERELEAARQQAERASALKSAFLARVSHEIRTPLNAILGFTEVMMKERFGPIGNPRYQDYIKDIHASGALVMSLVNDLLDLSKIEAGKMDFEFAPVDANGVVAECVSIMQPQAGEEKVGLKLSLSPALPHILADERALRQIILNLLSNAVKFNRPGGRVMVSTLLADAGNAIIRIRDSGGGMSEADIGAAFEPFQRLPTARPANGTGLGLPLTKALVEAHHASLTIKSKEQEGTLVEIVFPPARILAE
ncbi:MAG TPA: PAS domain-containing sensor histidine kinase [Methylocella sp.]|nr:PAS domain-containing sensor histidine kinase [Methylocella sp.]